MTGATITSMFVLNGMRNNITLGIDANAEGDQAWLEAVLTEARTWRTAWRWGEKVTLSVTELAILAGEEGLCLD